MDSVSSDSLDVCPRAEAILYRPSVLGTYTWSLNQELSFSGAGNVYSSQPGTPQNNYDLESEWGLSTSHTPHRFSTAVTYDLPFGKGRAFLSSNRWIDYAVGGWSINTIGTIQTGYPLAITQINNNSVIGILVQRPNATGVSPATTGSLTDRLDGYINPAAFTQADQFTFGNVSRTIGMRGPGQVNWDVSVFKTFAIGEIFKAQFRAEALNFTNTPLFYGPTPNSEHRRLAASPVRPTSLAWSSWESGSSCKPPGLHCGGPGFCVCTVDSLARQMSFGLGGSCR